MTEASENNCNLCISTRVSHRNRHFMDQQLINLLKNIIDGALSCITQMSKILLRLHTAVKMSIFQCTLIYLCQYWHQTFSIDQAVLGNSP